MIRQRSSTSLCGTSRSRKPTLPRTGVVVAITTGSGRRICFGYLRYPGRPLREGERPSDSLLAFVAEQIDVSSDAISGYLDMERNRQRQSINARRCLGFVRSADARRRS